ncbi:MAG: hypothetical protein PHT19_04980 [Methylococcus sp.]|nr:hypothetical protein [Methylococcus sp.]
MPAPDFSSLTANIDFSSAASAIVNVAAAVGGALIAALGVRMVHSSVTGKPFNLTQRLKDAGYPDRDAAHVSREAEGGPDFAGREADAENRSEDR